MIPENDTLLKHYRQSSPAQTDQETTVVVAQMTMEHGHDLACAVSVERHHFASFSFEVLIQEAPAWQARYRPVDRQYQRKICHLMISRCLFFCKRINQAIWNPFKQKYKQRSKFIPLNSATQTPKGISPGNLFHIPLGLTMLVNGI